MCEYCEKQKEIFAELARDHVIDETLRIKTLFKLQIFDGKRIGYLIGIDCNDQDAIRIHYCPMCGRRLEVRDNSESDACLSCQYGPGCDVRFGTGGAGC